MKVIIYIALCLVFAASFETVEIKETSVGDLLLEKGKRGVADFLLQNLGLSSVWNEIQTLGGNFVAQLTTIGAQLLFAGKQTLDNAKAIFAKLVSDLTNHTADAATLVGQAIGSLNQALGQNGKRGITDFLLQTLGLQSVWNEIQSLGGNFVSQILAIGSQLLFAGTQALNNAKPILSKLVSDLTNHVGDASTIVAQAIASLTQVVGNGKRGISDFIFQTLGLGSVLSEIQNLGGNFVSQIMAIGSQLLFAGTQALNNAKPILAKLVSDLTNHVGDAATIVAQAIASLSQISGGKRGVTDFLLQTLGLQSVWNEIQTLGGNFAAQLIAIGAQLLFAGSQSLNNAKAIFAKLVSDLTNHTSDASTLVSQAIGSLNQVLG